MMRLALRAVPGSTLPCRIVANDPHPERVAAACSLRNQNRRQPTDAVYRRVRAKKLATASTVWTFTVGSPP
jgi:hypothetical protein